MFDEVTGDTAEFYDASKRVLIPKLLGQTWMAETRRAFLTRVSTPGFILDAGAGPGRDMEIFRGHGHTVLGIDPSAAFAEFANATGRGPVVLGDVRRVPLPGGICDGVWMASVLVHFPKSEAPAVLQEIRRVLKPGGVLGLVTSKGRGESWRPDPATGTRSFNSHYTPEQLDDLLAAAGFTVVIRNECVRPDGRPQLERLAEARQL